MRAVRWIEAGCFSSAVAPMGRCPLTGNDRLERFVKVGKNFLGGFAIAAPVGDWAKGAENRHDDVETIQLMLEYVSRKRGRKEMNPGGIDGKISRVPGRSQTVKAIHAFQRTFLPGSDGLVEPGGRTLKQLQAEVQGVTANEKQGTKSVMQSSHPSDHMPPWLHAFDGLSAVGPLPLLPTFQPPKPEWIAIAEQELGQKEIAGKKHNPRIVGYHATTSNAKTDESPWCASFVNWVLKQSGYEGAGSAWSHAWKKWGDGLSKPAVGAVAFIDWGKTDPAKKDKGHVGFVVGKTSKNSIVLLGGNQGDSVSYAAFKPSLIQAYRVPKGYTPAAKLYELPTMKVSPGGGGYTATR